MSEYRFPKPPFPREFYEDLRSARPNFRLVKDYVIPLTERGKATVVKKGQTIRIVCVEGAQVADVWFWNADNYDEYFWNEFTLNREGFFVTTFSRLWSNMPKLRPMMTIIEDTVENKPTHLGSAHHFVFGGHCNPHYWYWVLRDKNHPYVTTFNCYYNCLRAVARFGLGPLDLHDNFHLFMKCYFDLETGLHPLEPSDARKGSYVEFYAEMDVLVAVSVCSNGSGSLPLSVGEQDIKPLGLEIYETGIQPLEFEDILKI